MAKNKTIGTVTFNSDAVKGMSRDQFIQAHSGIYNAEFEGYPDQEQKAQEQLEQAFDQLNPAPAEAQAPVKKGK